MKKTSTTDCEHRLVRVVCRHCGLKSRTYQTGKLLRDDLKPKLISGLDTHRKSKG